MTTNELLKKILALHDSGSVDVVPDGFKPLAKWAKELGKAQESSRRIMRLAVAAGLVESKTFVVFSGRSTRKVQHFRASEQKRGK
tara:strand:+ start:4354 stop:4608 length:255 start_codon:yes stop_codon:yes gene_type:complete